MLFNYLYQICNIETANENLVYEGRNIAHSLSDLMAVFLLTWTGANPTTESHNANVVKICNAASILVRFKNKNSFLYLKNYLAYILQRCSRKFQSRVIGYRDRCYDLLNICRFLLKTKLNYAKIRS
jgi:hypothetical protein